jgi:hypothetical protein
MKIRHIQTQMPDDFVNEFHEPILGDQIQIRGVARIIEITNALNPDNTMGEEQLTIALVIIPEIGGVL